MDDIDAEFVKDNDPEMIEYLKLLFNRIITGGTVPL